jgi:hypothetical protein
MEGSVLSFLKAEWKVSDTGSAHWASRAEPLDFIIKAKLQLIHSEINFLTLMVV